MNILLVAINSKYIHTSLAVHCLQAYAAKYRDHISIREFTINHRLDYILAQIYKEKPDVIAISTYVWNIEIVEELIVDIKKVLPSVDIWLGGPEVSYDAKETLIKYKEIKGIMRGEGEGVFEKLVDFYVSGNRTLDQIRGLSVRFGEEILSTPAQEPLNLDDIPFPYENLGDFENQILYYESSRGCPFNCSYCLSSIDRSVRFKSIELVKKDLSIFLANKVKQVKFVDRTFNCKKQHALSIWKFLREHDNGITNFHFEISADLIDDDTIAFLQGVRPNLFQFEIGVQSTNPKTIKEIHRNMDLIRLKEVVKRLSLNHNIHIHLDLIAGLPYEDYSRFQQSFNEVYELKPEALQLGFLKVLKGSYMHENRGKYGIQYRNQPPYEVLKTQDLSYEELLTLKAVENMIDIYYNSNHFIATISYLLRFHETPYDLYYQLAKYYERNSLEDMNHSRLTKYNILRDFAGEKCELDLEFVDNSLIYDLYCVEKLRKRPDWSREMIEERAQIKRLDKSIKAIKNYHIEAFTYDILDFVQSGRISKKSCYVLFNYENRDPISNHAQMLGLNMEGLY